MNQMAAFPQTGVATPFPFAPSRLTASTDRVSETSAPRQEGNALRPQTPGDLVGRADLSDEAVLTAIAQRMEFEGRDASKARAVLNAALAGRPVACAFLRRLVLPPPQSALAMPVQSILREPSPAREDRGSWFSRLSFGR